MYFSCMLKLKSHALVSTTHDLANSQEPTPEHKLCINGHEFALQRAEKKP